MLIVDLERLVRLQQQVPPNVCFIAFRQAKMNYDGRLYRKMVQDITVTDGDGVRDKTE